MHIIIAFGTFLIFSCIWTKTAFADLSVSDRATLNTVIEDFIRNNPKTLRDSLLLLAAREEAERKKAGLALLQNDLGDPTMGNPDGDISLYEFSDYNCGYCKRIFGSIQQLLRDNPDVKLVIKEFPILSQSSVFAAKAAIAAEIQGKFDDYHIGMMTYRGQITNAVVMQVAQNAGLDKAQLKRDLESPETAAIIERTRAAATALAINGTPALIVGDNIVPGAISLDELRTLIANERSKQG